MRCPQSLLLVLLAAGLAACHDNAVTPRPSFAVGNTASAGEWSPVMQWPVPPVHTHVLPDGRVMSWGSDPNSNHYQDATIWDPVSGNFQGVPSLLVNVFCSGHSLLPDGTLLVTGGHFGQNLGVRDVQTFDFTTGTWTVRGTMAAGRWYPTTTVLANGSVLIVSGTNEFGTDNTLPEVWSTNNTLRPLTSAKYSLPWYPWMFLAPDGRVFMAGPSKYSRWLKTAGTGQWANGPVSHLTYRGYGSAVMYEVGKILIVGGGIPPTNTAETIDISAGGAWKQTGSMAFPRRQLNATILADGKVLATGGTTTPAFNDPAGSVYPSEIWDPATGHWTAVSSISVNRNYHSTTVLLPDGRVFSGGGTAIATPGETNSTNLDAQIFSPPYLFQSDGTPAVRPTLTAAPTNLTWGQSFSVTTPDAATISRVSFIRLGSVTHAFDQGQRYIRLAYTAGTSDLTVTAPLNAKIAPPGYYMLFLVNTAGVPSQAAIIRVD